MAKIIRFQQGEKEFWDVVALPELPRDMRRMLHVQIRELIHEIEDCEDGSALPQVVKFIERCYQAA
jgi:hypothetical protein